MKIYDCFLFNGENLVLEIRLNQLSKFIDYFIIVEFGETHSGIKKKSSIDKDILKKFKNKIRYFYLKEEISTLNSWERESYQRNQISKGLFDASDDDLIIISDSDEIPNLEKINFREINENVYAFSQKHSMYKINLYRNTKWIGSKMCKKKVLPSPQWLRSLKVHKKYKPYRLDKLFDKTYYPKFKIIENGGWHLGWLMKTDEIIKKLESYAHTEHNNNVLKDPVFINDCMVKKISFLDTRDILTVDTNLENIPSYIRKNLKRYYEWLLKE
jgi:beta-1,4-mannosyl-glycoprotein beta-1,4-N-acetylglucosaminyltransferase